MDLGVRVSIFMQGCSFNCKECFNPETHDFNGGLEFCDKTIQKVLELCDKEYIKGLSILGGEPLHPNNIDGTTQLAKEFKKRYPNKTIWVWTGFLFENRRNEEIMNYIDVLVDGQFKEECYNPSLKWKGSENQRVINIPLSLKEGKIIQL